MWVYSDSIDVAISLLAAAYDNIAHEVFANVPLFALMGIVSSEVGLGADVYKVANQIFRRVRGGLGISCFTIKSTIRDPTITLSLIFSGAFPFACIMLLVPIAIIAFPWLSLALL